MFYYQQVLRNFWLGYGERCRHFAQKGFARIPQGKYFFHIIKFYYGLSLLDMTKKKLNCVRFKEVEEIIESMKVAVKHADSNIRNNLSYCRPSCMGLVLVTTKLWHYIMLQSHLLKSLNSYTSRGWLARGPGYTTRRWDLHEMHWFTFNRLMRVTKNGARV